MTEILLLRLVHVLGGIFWVGSGLFTTLFLIPALAGVGPAAGEVMGAMQRRRLFVVMPAVAVVTILSGLRLMWIVSGGFGPSYFATPMGATFAASGAAATVVFVVALVVKRRSPVIQWTLTALLVASAAGMAVARYLA